MDQAPRAVWPISGCILRRPRSCSKKGVRSVPEAEMAYDGDVWEKNLERFRVILRFVAARGLNPRYWRRVDPSDMVQKTMLEAHAKRADYRGSSDGELEGWLKSILQFRILDEIRRLHRVADDVNREVEAERAEAQVRRWTSPLSALIRQENILRLAEAMEKLSDDERRAVELRHLHGLSLAETANGMERSRYAVARLLRQALPRLLDEMR